MGGIAPDQKFEMCAPAPPNIPCLDPLPTRNALSEAKSGWRKGLRKKFWKQKMFEIIIKEKYKISEHQIKPVFKGLR